jgi:hypothetical protein
MKRALRTLFVLAAVAASVLALRVVSWRPLTLAGAAPGDGHARVEGVVHVHTTLSDGGGTPEEVIEAARAAGLDFVALTDHGSLDAWDYRGYHDDVLVIVGTEISTTDGHLLALGLSHQPAYRFTSSLADALEDVEELGGVPFAAHPVNPRAELLWDAWGAPGGWGVEILNGDSQWRTAGWARLARAVVLYGLNQQYGLASSLTAPEGTLAKWDALLAARDAAGILGTDAHSRVRVTAERSLRFPSYEAMFRAARNHVRLDRPLTGEAEADERAIVEALARGRAYVGVDALAPAGGFAFVGRAGERRLSMGDSVVAGEGEGVTLSAGGALPAGARVTLLRDGQVIRDGEGEAGIDGAGPGTYRVEVRVPGWELPWILSNPIHVAASAEALVARRERSVRPPEPPAPDAVLLIDSFDAPGESRFTAAADPTSVVEADVADPEGGLAGTGAARLSFRLSAPSDAQPSPYCALIGPAPPDLTAYQGLVFSIRGDDVYRIWVQVRDENPAASEEGTDWWFASVKATPEWRRAAVPFSSLRSINPGSDGRLDLDKVRSIAFVLDRGALRAPAGGTVWIDEVGLY